MIEKALRILHSLLLLKSDEDCLYETDYERLHELLECMVLHQVKQVEDDFRRHFRGNYSPTIQMQPYDSISNNPFYYMKVSMGDTDSMFLRTCEKLSTKVT